MYEQFDTNKMTLNTTNFLFKTFAVVNVFLFSIGKLSVCIITPLKHSQLLTINGLLTVGLKKKVWKAGLKK